MQAALYDPRHELCGHPPFRRAGQAGVCHHQGQWKPHFPAAITSIGFDCGPDTAYAYYSIPYSEALWWSGTSRMKSGKTISCCSRGTSNFGTRYLLFILLKYRIYFYCCKCLFTILATKLYTTIFLFSET